MWEDVELLESVQKFALKVCCKQWSSPYEDLLEISRLSSLQARRETARLVYMYKLVHKLVDFQEAPIQYRPPLPYGTRHRNLLDLNPFQYREFLNSFFPRTSSSWNRLTTDTVTITSIMSFKHAIT